LIKVDDKPVEVIVALATLISPITDKSTARP